MEHELAVIDAFKALHIDVEAPTSAGHGADLVVAGTPLNIKRSSLVTEDAARRLLSQLNERSSVLFVVADRLTKDGRETLLKSGAGFLDLRGHLAIRVRGLVVDAQVPPLVSRTARKDPLSGAVGIEVAISLMMHTDVPGSVRNIARLIGRSASTVSEVLAALRERELIDSTRRVTDNKLFWEVAERWPTERIYLRTLPPLDSSDPLARTLRMGIGSGNGSVGWALTDSAAALAYEAPVALRTDSLLDFYVPDRVTAGRAATLLGEAVRASDARCAVKVAPVLTICRDRVDSSSLQAEWPLAHPLFVALDLAQDRGRGREILAGWNPGSRWARVW